VPAGRAIPGKIRRYLQEIPGGSCPHFRIYRPVSVIWQIRQIHKIYQPHYFHWKKPVTSPDWINGREEVLFQTGDIGVHNHVLFPHGFQKKPVKYPDTSKTLIKIHGPGDRILQGTAARRVLRQAGFSKDRKPARPGLNTRQFYHTLQAKPIMDEKTEAMRHYIKTTLTQPGSHGLDHVLRVVHLCEVIGKEEDADMAVLLPAALFHDIARPLEKEKGIPHEKAGAEMAERYLRSIRYDKDRIPKITHAIRAHRYRTTEQPETPEAKILSDADKLDAMGAVGIARTFIRAGEHHGEIGDAVDHMNDKLLKLRRQMYTKTAKKLAEKRHRYLRRFLETLRDETALPGMPA
jgi:uncharacterized protein